MSAKATAQQNGSIAQEEASVLLRSIHPVNFLSFGPDALEIPLRSLNVLIGPNGSGKSNLIEAVDVLRSSATRLADTLRKGGGVQEWIWKGNPDQPALLNAVLSNPHGSQPLRHSLAFAAQQQGFRLTDERIENEHVYGDKTKPYFFYKYQQGTPLITVQDKRLRVRHIESDQSILAQRKDPERYPEITYLAEQYGRIRLYREWSFGRKTIFREPQHTDLRSDRLEEDFSNLCLFLNYLRRNPKAKNTLLTYLRDLYEGIDDFDLSVLGGTIQVFFTEGELEGKFTIPATRLSDGTLRYLCLLAILCDPNPPPLICIEEPELGLHPDIIHKIADLLVEASSRTQLIVTTHSDILVDALTERPEAILVLEKRARQTQVKRLSAEELSVWLKKYSLGELWTRGDLGGKRW